MDARKGIKQALVVLRSYDTGEVDFDDVSFVSTGEVFSLRLHPAEHGKAGIIRLSPDLPKFIHFVLRGESPEYQRLRRGRLRGAGGVNDFGLLGGGTATVRNEKKYRKFRISFPRSTLTLLKRTVSQCYVTARLDARKAPRKEMIYYRPAMDGKELSEKQAKLVLLPPAPRGARPERFHTFFCCGTFGDVLPQLHERVYETIRSMGINHHLAQVGATGWRKYLQNKLHTHGGHL